VYVGIREAKANFSNLVKKVRQGADIIITDHGNPVCKLTRLTNEELPLYQRVAALEQTGMIIPQVKETRKLPPPLPVKTDVQSILQEDRKRG
jgi:antitoxin (DNA-binding transcriptional repressor) of toxin-antitoxin stability system